MSKNFDKWLEVSNAWGTHLAWAWILAVAIYLPTAYFGIPALTMPDAFDIERHLVPDPATGELVDSVDLQDDDGNVPVTRWCDPKNGKCFSAQDKQIKAQRWQARWAQAFLTLVIGSGLAYLYAARDLARSQFEDREVDGDPKQNFGSYCLYVLIASGLSISMPLTSLLGHFLGGT